MYNTVIHNIRASATYIRIERNEILVLSDIACHAQAHILYSSSTRHSRSCFRATTLLFFSLSNFYFLSCFNFYRGKGEGYFSWLRKLWRVEGEKHSPSGVSFLSSVFILKIFFFYIIKLQFKVATCRAHAYIGEEAVEYLFMKSFYLLFFIIIIF